MRNQFFTILQVTSSKLLLTGEYRSVDTAMHPLQRDDVHIHAPIQHRLQVCNATKRSICRWGEGVLEGSGVRRVECIACLFLCFHSLTHDTGLKRAEH